MTSLKHKNHTYIDSLNNIPPAAADPVADLFEAAARSLRQLAEHDRQQKAQKARVVREIDKIKETPFDIHKRLSLGQKFEDIAEHYYRSDNKPHGFTFRQWREHLDKLERRIREKRDKDIYQAYLSGKSNPEIADQFGLSVRQIVTILKKEKLNHGAGYRS